MGITPEDLTSINYDELISTYLQLVTTRDNLDVNEIGTQNTFISNCTGDAITEINGCISVFDQICRNINTLYLKSEAYVWKVKENYQQCENDNSVDN